MNDRCTEPGDLAPDVFALDGPEHLLVWATRKCAFRCGNAILVDREFCQACGERLGQAVAAAFREFLRLLARHARRPVALGPPGWCGVTHDEHRLLQLFAAAQMEAEDRMRMHLAWLMPATAAREARPRVVLVAAALRDHGHRLSLARIGDRGRCGPITRLDERS